MATPAELERLDALVKRLSPLSNAARGELIRADDWNTMVLAIVELARTVYSESQENSIPPHSHFDEVSMAWLDKQLRSLVSGGSLKDPIQTGKLNSVERKLGQLNSDLTLRKEDIGRTLKVLDNISTRELARENQVQRLDRQVSGLRSANDEVGELRLTLAGISAQITTVQGVADQLRDSSGELVDVASLQSQVNTLNELRNSLVDANGEIISGIGIDQKISAALNTLVTEEEMKEAIDERLRGLDSRIDTTVDTRLSASLDQAIGTRLDDFRAQINRDNSQLFANLDATISRTVADQLPLLTDSITSTVEQQMDQRLEQMQQSFTSEITQTNRELRDELTAADSRLEQQLKADIDRRFDELIDRQRTIDNDSLTLLRRDLETQIASNNTQLTATLTRDLNATLDTRLANLNRGTLEGRTDLRSDLRTNPRTDLVRARAVEREGPSDADRTNDLGAINGIGRTYKSRLDEANIRSFQVLSEQSPRQLAAITGMSIEQVEKLDLIGQARRLLEGQQ